MENSKELIGILQAISIIAKNLAEKLMRIDKEIKYYESSRGIDRENNEVERKKIGWRKGRKFLYAALSVEIEAADIVRRIFLMVAAGLPRRDGVKILNKENVPTAAVYK